jgi:hypothetical protein
MIRRYDPARPVVNQTAKSESDPLEIVEVPATQSAKCSSQRRQQSSKAAMAIGFNGAYLD